MQAFVGVTDEAWFELLASRPNLDEANFWQPSGSRGPVLEAAHIRGVAEGGAHSVDNGLLLRADLHTLFDRGYIAVTTDHRIEVSRRIREEFSNGRAYSALHGGAIELPKVAEHAPAVSALQWHNENVFRG